LHLLASWFHRLVVVAQIPNVCLGGSGLMTADAKLLLDQHPPRGFVKEELPGLPALIRDREKRLRDGG